MIPHRGELVVSYLLPERVHPVYESSFGQAYHGDSRFLLELVPQDSVNLVITSPPFALQRQKAYGNKEQEEYVDWLMEFGRKVYKVLRADGSFVLDLGGAYQKGVPVRSLYQFKVLIRFCEEIGFFLAEDFYWHNSSKLPSPIEWVNKRKIRTKDTINTVWWFSKTEWPHADVREVLCEYSDRMRKLLTTREKYYTPKERPSGHDISAGFFKDNGGAIPSNLLQIPNTESNSQYLRLCKVAGAEPHPARFPAKLPDFFIKFLTRPNDLVLDIFAGSNTTGEVAQSLGRRWLALDERLDYLATSIFRFVSEEHQAEALYRGILAGESVCLQREVSAEQTRLLI